MYKIYEHFCSYKVTNLIPNEHQCPLVGWLVGRLVWHNFQKKVSEEPFHAPIGALVLLLVLGIRRELPKLLYKTNTSRMKGIILSLFFFSHE